MNASCLLFKQITRRHERQRSAGKQDLLHLQSRQTSHYHEELVRKDYPYVSTTVLTCHGRLNQHSYYSDNVHRINHGSISINNARDEKAWLRKTTGDTVIVDKGVMYIGVPGPEGCIFVEGHEDLSPTTAERFRGRGTIVPVPKDTPDAFTTSSPSNSLSAGKYAYNPKKTQTAAEQEVPARGHRFVNTVTIKPYDPSIEAPDNGIVPERGHHTHCTHKVTAGEFLITNTRTKYLEFPPMRIKSGKRIEISGGPSVHLRSRARRMHIH